MGNHVLAPHFYYLTASQPIWMYFFARGLAKLDSNIVDIGSGVGKSAVALRDFEYHRLRFEGMYHGFDVDPEMVRWSKENFPEDRFRFRVLDVRSSVYRPDVEASAAPVLDLPDGEVDLVFSQSLFSHLLEDDVKQYLAEAFRVLRPGGHVHMTFFCLEYLQQLGLLGDRWTFAHTMGNARIESLRYPEAAVAYTADWMAGAARACGFSEANVILSAPQSVLECRK